MSISFNSATTFPLNRNPNSVAVGDVNGDTFLDIVTGTTQSSSGGTSSGISTLLGNSTGSFGTVITSTGQGSSSGQFGAGTAIALGDFNNDQKLDVITLGSVFGLASSDVFIALGDGKGSFTPTSNLVVGDNPQAVAVGDVNGDGFLDAVTANSGGRNLSVLLGDGKGAIKSTTPLTLEGNAKTVALRDFNGDGRLDIAATTVVGGTGKLAVLLGDGAGNFTTTPSIDLGEASNYGASDITVGDFNGDGRADVATLTGGKVFVLLADPVQRFKPVFETELYANSITSGDFNGDGRIDLAVNASKYNSTTASILLGNGSGGFSRPVEFATAAGGSFFGSGQDTLAAADFNRDSKLDLTSVASAFTDASVLFNNTTATDAIAQGTTTLDGNTVGFIDASSDFSGAIETDLQKGTFVLNAATQVNKSVSGVDVVIGTVRGDEITGNNNKNLLNGSSGDDEISGLKGDDRIVGGAGRDELEGGKGSDRFIFSTTPNYPEGLETPFSKGLVGVDRILDFELGKDKIVLDAGTFTALEAGKKVKFDTVGSLAEAKSSSGLITYNENNGKLYYNQNGSKQGIGTGGQFAVLEGDIALSAKNFSVFL